MGGNKRESKGKQLLIITHAPIPRFARKPTSWCTQPQNHAKLPPHPPPHPHLPFLRQACINHKLNRQTLFNFQTQIALVQKTKIGHQGGQQANVRLSIAPLQTPRTIHKKHPIKTSSLKRQYPGRKKKKNYHSSPYNRWSQDRRQVPPPPRPFPLLPPPRERKVVGKLGAQARPAILPQHGIPGALAPEDHKGAQDLRRPPKLQLRLDTFLGVGVGVRH